MSDHVTHRAEASVSASSALRQHCGALLTLTQR
jgi:hypothetical protein